MEIAGEPARRRDFPDKWREIRARQREKSARQDGPPSSAVATWIRKRPASRTTTVCGRPVGSGGGGEAGTADPDVAAAAGHARGVEVPEEGEDVLAGAAQGLADLRHGHARRAGGRAARRPPRPPPPPPRRRTTPAPPPPPAPAARARAAPAGPTAAGRGATTAPPPGPRGRSRPPAGKPAALVRGGVDRPPGPHRDPVQPGGQHRPLVVVEGGEVDAVGARARAPRRPAGGGLPRAAPARPPSGRSSEPSRTPVRRSSSAASTQPRSATTRSTDRDGCGPADAGRTGATSRISPAADGLRPPRLAQHVAVAGQQRQGRPRRQPEPDQAVLPGRDRVPAQHADPDRELARAE